MSNMYLTPIPAPILAIVPGIVSSLDSEAFDVRVTAFASNDGEQLFSVDAYTEARTVTPDDKRMKSYVETRETSWYFDVNGNMTDDSPSSYLTRYRG